MVVRLWFLGIALVAFGACRQFESREERLFELCETRAQWTQDKAYACARCRLASSEPRCDCSDIPEKYKSRCAVEATRVRASPACRDYERVEHSSCQSRCGGDCVCAQQCTKALSPECEFAMFDLDTCTVDTCDEACR